MFACRLIVYYILIFIACLFYVCLELIATACFAVNLWTVFLNIHMCRGLHLEYRKVKEENFQNHCIRLDKLTRWGRKC